MRNMFQSALFLILVIVLSACSYTATEVPVTTTNSSLQNDTLEIGPVNRTNTPFYQGLEEGLGTRSGIKVVRYFLGDDHGPNSLVLKGEIEVDARDEFRQKVSRHLFGFGVNRRVVNGLFKIEDSNHVTLMTFTANEYYNGGTGLGGLIDVPGWIIGPFVEGIPYFCQADIISTDTMQKRLGVEVGEQVRDWLLAMAPQ